MNGDPQFCPKCKADFTGKPIPKEYIDKGYYAPGRTHYSRLIGVEDPAIYDGIWWWRCPDCGFQWERFNFKDANTATEALSGPQ